jgi:hypothetical protein
MRAGDLPHFTRFFEASTIYTTTAGDAPLEPWVQWPSIHCGVPYDEHRALHLGDGRRVAQKGIGTILSEHGVRVGVFGTMNGNYTRLNGYYLPDPWDERACVHPDELLTYFDFVAHQVKENTREPGLGVGPALRFGRFMLRHGLTLRTAFAIAAQLAIERRRPALRWKRALVLDLLQYDVFRWLNARYDVQFASFFANGTAHLQHYFWRDMDPHGFEEPPDPRADPSLATAVPCGYRSMDTLLGRFMRDYPSHRLILCTGLSQEPWFDTTKCTYRPTDFAALLRFAGVDERVRVLPAMAERFRLACATESDARATKRALDTLVVRGRTVMASTVDGTVVYTGCGIMDPGPALLDEPVFAGTRVERFGRLFYQTTAMNSCRHAREGSLWVRDGQHRVVAGDVPIESIAPTILAHFGIDVPAPMRRELALPLTG